MSREAMQLALEALENPWEAGPDGVADAIIALRQALEEKQEPVAWLKTWSDGSVSVLKTKSHAFADHELEPLYTAPPKKQWVGLTDDEIEEMHNEIKVRLMGTYRTEDIYRSIEAKLREKNT